VCSLDTRGRCDRLCPSWVASVTAGHTKRIMTNAILLIAYCVGNIVSPFMWQARYAPRNYVPWGIIAGCLSVCAIISLVLRWVFAGGNAPRDKEEYGSTYDDLYVEHIIPEGKKIEMKVSKVCAPPSLHTFGCRSDLLSVHRNSWISRIDKTATSAMSSDPVQVYFFVIRWLRNGALQSSAPTPNRAGRRMN
jgi:hypothetical protein